MHQKLLDIMEHIKKPTDKRKVDRVRMSTATGILAACCPEC